ncbi:MAG: type II toxin-antitoxin system VapC family toxin [Actinobacteria bacterium]|nr:type II toxin-antitoxin system VapC family toxin [Actinomycetota bacterium]
MTYLDSSAIVKLIRRENGSESLHAAARDWDHVASSALGRIEVLRAVRRRGGPDLLDRATQVLESLFLIPMDNDIIGLAAELDPPGLRTLDSIHLASALSLGDPLERLVTYDHRLADAADRVSIPVFSPGAKDSS